MLQYLGEFPHDKEIIAIIGPRTPVNVSSTELYLHQQDCSMAYELARHAAKKGIVVLSGLASGIDTAAHRGCLDAGGQTIAVVPFGLAAPIFPPENRSLFDKIITQNGCIVSQFKPEQPVAKWTFVARDKTQAEIAQKVFVVGTFPPNGLITGGTKHCARWTRKMDKPLYHYRQIAGTYAIFSDHNILIDK